PPFAFILVLPMFLVYFVTHVSGLYQDKGGGLLLLEPKERNFRSIDPQGKFGSQQLSIVSKTKIYE
ncbi:hypothetical protein CH371_19970, partial [Leptospira wolffii]